MRAGALKFKLILYQPQMAVNRFGEEARSFDKYRTVAAERVKHTGRRSEEVGEHFAAYTAEYNIRDAHPVDEGWRVQQLGGHLYNVTAVIHNLDRGMKTLICERVNE